MDSVTVPLLPRRTAYSLMQLKMVQRLWTGEAVQLVQQALQISDQAIGSVKGDHFAGPILEV